MLEEQRQKQVAAEQTRNEKVNQQVVKLLHQKTIPLNKGRYLRLQTLTRVSPKHSSPIESLLPNISAPQLLLHLDSPTQELPRFPKARTSRGNVMPTADLLINRLKNLKDLKHSSQLLVKNEQAGRCWQALRNCIIESEQSPRKGKLSTIPTQKSLKISQSSKRKRQTLLQLAKKAEQHLRLKKHQLKEKHSQQVEYQDSSKIRSDQPSEIQKLLTSFRQMKHSNILNQKQMEMELLREIKETMLEEKINRIKRDINHKKIVQLR